jgi:hypothetical protein
MPRVGTLLQFIGGALGRVAMSGVLIGLFFIVVGVTPGQFFGGLFQHPPQWMGSVWFAPGLILIGLMFIALSLWFNFWSNKQKAIDDLAEDIAWAITNLLNRSPRPSSAAEVAQWEAVMFQSE